MQSTTSDAAISPSAATAVAACRVKPPAKIARRRNTTRSSFGQQLVAPVKRRAQGLMARHCGATAAREQAQIGRRDGPQVR